MSDVEVPFGKSTKETATVLLGTAMTLGHDPSVVRVGNGVFFAPEDVVLEAFPNAKAAPAAEEKPKPAKVEAKATAAKKTTAKKTASKKAE